MDEKITSLSFFSFESLFTFKRFLKNSEIIIIEGLSQPVEWTIDVYQKKNMSQ